MKILVMKYLEHELGFMEWVAAELLLVMGSALGW
jgi:hypothetical protein